jgi:hypothetical protein
MNKIIIIFTLFSLLIITLFIFLLYNEFFLNIVQTNTSQLITTDEYDYIIADIIADINN